jgi:AcrR family transcriptional regulator
LDALADRGFSRLGAELRAAYATAGQEFDQRLRRTMTACVAFASRSPAVLELMFATKPRSDAAPLELTAADALSVVALLIQEGMCDGVLAPADPDRYTLLLAATIRASSGPSPATSSSRNRRRSWVAAAAATFSRGNAP